VTRSTSSSLRMERTPVSFTIHFFAPPVLTIFHRRHHSLCHGRGGRHRCQGGSQGLDFVLFCYKCHGFNATAVCMRLRRSFMVVRQKGKGNGNEGTMV
jgi:hypothetical protein